MTFEINEGSNEDYDQEVGTDWTDDGLGNTEIYFDQEYLPLGYTMGKGNVVSLRSSENYCNFSEFTLSGTGDLKTTMQIAMGAHDWNDD